MVVDKKINCLKENIYWDITCYYCFVYPYKNS